MRNLAVPALRNLRRGTAALVSTAVQTTQMSQVSSRGLLTVRRAFIVRKIDLQIAGVTPGAAVLPAAAEQCCTRPRNWMGHVAFPKALLAIKDRVALVYNAFRITHAVCAVTKGSPVMQTGIAAVAFVNPTHIHALRRALHSAKTVL